MALGPPENVIELIYFSRRIGEGPSEPSQSSALVLSSVSSRGHRSLKKRLSLSGRIRVVSYEPGHAVRYLFVNMLAVIVGATLSVSAVCEAKHCRLPDGESSSPKT